jgi:hypothetical protein
MSNKIVLLFTASVIMASFGMLAIPAASALNPNPVDNSHVTDRFNSEHKICGTHLCAPGERTSWEKAVWDHQKVTQGKITHVSQHGEDVMKKMAGSTPNPTTAHGSEKPTVHSTMPVINATKNVNMTGNIPNNK